MHGPPNVKDMILFNIEKNCQIFRKDSGRHLHATLNTCQPHDFFLEIFCLKMDVSKRKTKTKKFEGNEPYLCPALKCLKTCLHTETSHVARQGVFNMISSGYPVWWGKPFLFSVLRLSCVLTYISTRGLFPCHFIARSTSKQ